MIDAKTARKTVESKDHVKNLAFLKKAEDAVILAISEGQLSCQISAVSMSQEACDNVIKHLKSFGYNVKQDKGSAPPNDSWNLLNISW